MEEFNADELNAEIEALDLDKLEASLFQDNVEREMTCADACKVWKKVRIILLAIVKSGFLNPKHKKALQLLGRTLDRICLK